MVIWLTCVVRNYTMFVCFGLYVDSGYGDFPACIGGGRPRMYIAAVFQARTATRVEPPTPR